MNKSLWHIRFDSGDGRHQPGDCLSGHGDHALIGGSIACDIRIESPEDSPYACIVRNRDGISWRLVRMDDDADIRVNGEQLHIVHYLKDGERITIGENGTELIFSGKDTGIDAKRYYSKFRKLLIGFACGCVAVTALLLMLLGSDDIRQWEIARHRQSICKISVTDIIYQEVRFPDGQEEVRTLDSLFLAEGSCSGTGFFDTKGSFITARHCVEPWISSSDPLSEMSRKEILWAAEAETFNILNGQDTPVYRRVISYCTIHKDGKEIHRFRTDTCRFSTDKDVIRNLRGVNDELYWRELGHAKWESALGDIASVSTGIKGSIHIAGREILESLSQNTPAAHWGYESASEDANFMTSRIKYAPTRKGGRITRCLVHSSKGIIQGFSGSPVMVRHNGRIYAAGIVSKNSENNSGTCYSVPASELEKLTKRW